MNWRVSGRGTTTITEVPAADGRCHGVTARQARCTLDDDGSGYCGTFHQPPGPPLVTPAPPRAPLGAGSRKVLDVLACVLIAALITVGVIAWEGGRPEAPRVSQPAGSLLEQWESPHGLGSAYYQSVLDALNQIAADSEGPGGENHLASVPPPDGANLIDAVTGALQDPPPVHTAVYMAALDQLTIAGHDLEQHNYHAARRALGAGNRNLGIFARDIESA